MKSLVPVTRGYNNALSRRLLATVHDVFPHKTDFPSRHIGPRKTEVVAMLDLLGFKVCIMLVIGLQTKQVAVIVIVIGSISSVFG